jgi:hypothetical protein
LEFEACGLGLDEAIEQREEMKGVTGGRVQRGWRGNLRLVGCSWRRGGVGGTDGRRRGEETEEGTDRRRHGEGLAGGTPRVLLASFRFLFFPCTGFTIPRIVQRNRTRPIPHLERGIVEERPMTPSHRLPRATH